MSVHAAPPSSDARPGRLRRALAGILGAAILASLAGPAVASANPWPSDGGDPMNLRYSTRGLSAGKAVAPTKLWSVTFPLDQGEVLGTPLIADNGLVYVGTTAGYVLAFTREKGDRVFATPASGITTRAPIYGGLLLAKGKLWAMVSATRSKYIVEMDPVTGDVLSRTIVDSSRDVEINGGLNYSAANDLIYFAFCTCKAEQQGRSPNIRGAVAAFDPDEKGVRWLTSTALTGGGSVWGTPMVLDHLNRVYVATGHGIRALRGGLDPYTDAILALDQSTGAIVGSYQAHAGDISPNDDPNPTEKQGFRAAVNASNGPGGIITVGAGARDGVYHSVNAVTMEPVFSQRVGAGSSVGGVTAGATFDGRQISGHSGIPGVLFGLQSKTGELTMAFPTEDQLARSPITSSRGVLYYTDTAGFLSTADSATGRPLGRVPLGAPSTTGVAVGKYRVVVAFGTGLGTPGGIAVFK